MEFFFETTLVAFQVSIKKYVKDVSFRVIEVRGNETNRGLHRVIEVITSVN